MEVSIRGWGGLLLQSGWGPIKYQVGGCRWVGVGGGQMLCDNRLGGWGGDGGLSSGRGWALLFGMEGVCGSIRGGEFLE